MHAVSIAINFSNLAQMSFAYKKGCVMMRKSLRLIRNPWARQINTFARIMGLNWKS